MKIMKNIYKKILFIVVACYVISIFISQQQTLNTYQAEIDKYDLQIQEAKETQSDPVAIPSTVKT